MKRFGVVLAVVLVVALLLPMVALAADEPIPLQPPMEEGAHQTHPFDRTAKTHQPSGTGRPCDRIIDPDL